MPPRRGQTGFARSDGPRAVDNASRERLAPSGIVRDAGSVIALGRLAHNADLLIGLVLAGVLVALIVGLTVAAKLRRRR